MFYLADTMEDLSPEDILSDSSEWLLGNIKGGPRVYRSFAKKKKKNNQTEHQKNYKLKQTKKQKTLDISS